jgi:polyhydroxyalkanoate synthesis repressor PhaR
MSQPNQPEGPTSSADKPPVVVKKYANRRLYNTESSSYITLDTLAEMVRVGRDFVVYDAKSGDDITRSVLTQIIVEEESKGRALLPTGFLRQLIGFYGDSMQGLVPKYLEEAMTNFARQQEKMRVTMTQTMGNFFPFGMEHVSRQNMAMMERAMSLFTPFYRPDLASEASGKPAVGDTDVMADNMRLRADMEALQAKVNAAHDAVAPELTARAEAITTLHDEVKSLRTQLAGARDAALGEVAAREQQIAALTSELATVRAQLHSPPSGVPSGVTPNGHTPAQAVANRAARRHGKSESKPD